MEKKMKLKKEIIVSFMILSLTFLVLNPGHAQVKGNPAAIFPGVVEQISADSKFIVVNEAKIFLSSDAKIMDAFGNSLTLSDLKRGSFITLEVIKSGDGFLAKTIVLKTRGR